MPPATEPINCNHLKAQWGGYCPTCGALMFMPPHMLAYRAGSDITAMDALWTAAGCPRWLPGLQSWCDIGDWRLMAHPLFIGPIGGIVVRADRLAEFAEMCRELAL